MNAAQLIERLLKAADKFRCDSTGRMSKVKGWAGRDCPCSGCMTQKEVLEVAEELRLYPQITAKCVCFVDDGLVQEWVSKARSIAISKGFEI